MAARLVAELSAAGYPLATTRHAAGTVPAAMEVYPHAAIVRLMRLGERLKYKVARSGKLWPRMPVPGRIANLISAFRELRGMIEGIAGPTALALPEPSAVASLASLKALEDGLDALVCALVGRAYLDGNAEALGDETAAIWVPTAD